MKRKSMQMKLKMKILQQQHLLMSIRSDIQKIYNN